MVTPNPSPAAATRVYVDMVGDLFHAGHVALLREARRHGDHLIVGVLSDDAAASYKRRPAGRNHLDDAADQACAGRRRLTP